MAKITNAELLTKLLAAISEQGTVLTEKLDALTGKVGEMATRRAPGRRKDDRRFSFTSRPPGRDTSIDVVIYERMKDKRGFTREEMIVRAQELIEDGKLKTKRSAKDIVAGTIPWALREGYMEVVPASEKVPVIDAVSVADEKRQAAE